MTDIRIRAPNARPPRAASSPSPAATGTRSPAASTRSATRRSSSTWARSTRPRTACSGWCWSSRARRSPRCRPVVGYLHTGIEKNLEYRNWTQGATFVTRMDYLSTMFNEAGYCLAVEKLLGITDQITERANTIRVLFMELNRISSHLVWLATTGMELGAISMMLYGFREREYILDIFEETSGLRMNNAYIRPGGLAQDLPDSAVAQDPRLPRRTCRRSSRSTRPCSPARSSGRSARRASRVLDVTGCLALGITGPVLRAAGLAWDLRKTHAVLRLRDVRVRRADRDHRRRVGPLPGPDRRDPGVAEDRRAGAGPAAARPDLVADKKIAWPAQLARRRWTAWATRWSTSPRSWVSRWSR